MKRFLGIAILAALVCANVGWADDHAGHEGMNMSSTAPAMPKPGPETKALAELFDGTATFTGNCPAGAMGPESKAMTTKGKAVGHVVGDGFWYACDVENKMGEGKESMTWRGHILIGYDMATQSYRAVCGDNMGTLAEYKGTMEPSKFTLETVAPTMMMGQAMDDRMTWEKTANGTWSFKEETRPQGGDWNTFQTATMVGSGKAKKATATAAN